METTASKTQTATSRAAVFTAAGEPMQVRRLPLRPPLPGEVRVRIRCCTVCGSDLHTYQGRRSTPTPTVLGHEVLGEVEMLGEGRPVRDIEGRPLQVGDRVTWSVAASCGNCFFCDDDLPQKCEHLFKYGHQPIRDDHPLSGGLAEHCLLAPGTAVVRIPEGVPDPVACPANCATATVAAALRMVRLRPGQTVLLQGMGALGLTAAAMARTLEARHVIACDPDPARLEMSRDFGATHVFRVGDGDPRQAAELCRELTAGRGVDAAMELSGAAESIRAGLPLLRIGGRYALVGSVFPNGEVPIDPEMVVRRMLTLFGLHNYRPDDLLAAVRFLAAHHRDFPFEKLVAGTWPLDEAETAFRHAIETRALRVAVTPADG